MSALQIYLFGSARLVSAGWTSEIKVTRTIQGLLGYLLLHRQRSHHRKVLADLFWGDHSEDRAHSCLSTALWRLRGALEPSGVPRGTYLVVTSAGDVGFNRESDYWLDVAVLEEQVIHAQAQPIRDIDATKLERSLDLYSDELLEGFYDDWALRERERLRGLYLNGLTLLMRYYKSHESYEESLVCGHKILSCDPLREEVHREMMRLYLSNGQRALSVRQFEACRSILRTELGIPPMEETQALYTQIVAGAKQPGLASTVVREASSLQQALQQLRIAVQANDKAREQLQRAIYLVERLVEGSD
jgi:DNA-binding SARP family transcriptional activator